MTAAREAWDRQEVTRRVEYLLGARSGVTPFGADGPLCSVEQGIYTVSWIAPLAVLPKDGLSAPMGVMLDFDYLSTERRTGETHAELTIYPDDPDNPIAMFRTRLNLLSLSTRASLVKQLNERYPRAGRNWQQMLDQAIQWVLSQHRSGEPAVILTDAPEPESVGSVLPPLIAEDGPTIFFGDGGASKSYLALAVAASLHGGYDVIPGMRPTRALRVGYLDWEWSAHVHKRRLLRLLPDSPPQILYVPMRLSLKEERDRLRRLIREHELAFLVLDSAGLAAGGAPEEAEVAIAFFATLRELGLPTLIIAHVNRNDSSRGSADRPFGCYSADTEVLTRRGWVSHDQVWTDDEVACFDPATETLRWDCPTKLHEYDYDGPMVAFRGGSVDMLVTPNHRMIVQPGWRDATDWEVREAGALTRAPWRLPYATAFEERDGTDDVSPAFASFLGWWISEGTLNAGAPVLTQIEGELARRMRAAVTALGYKATAWVGKSREQEQPVMQLRLRGAIELGTWLREQVGHHCWEKRIPDVAWRWSVDRRRALFLALMEGDGSWSHDGFGIYTTTSEALADDVQRLAIELGYSARVRRKAPRPGRPSWAVLIGNRRTLTIRAGRNIRYERYSGKVYCLTVPTGAYVTRRNGSMAIAGNSQYWHNSARSTWYVKAQDNPPPGQLHVALFHRKDNEEGRHPPIGLRWRWEGDNTWIEPAVIEADPSLEEELPVGKRITLLLREEHGPLTQHEMVDKLGKHHEASIRMALRRGAGKYFVKVPGGGGEPDRWALPARGDTP